MSDESTPASRALHRLWLFEMESKKQDHLMPFDDAALVKAHIDNQDALIGLLLDAIIRTQNSIEHAAEADDIRCHQESMKLVSLALIEVLASANKVAQDAAQ